jgi:hypothetical protein
MINCNSPDLQYLDVWEFIQMCFRQKLRSLSQSCIKRRNVEACTGKAVSEETKLLKWMWIRHKLRRNFSASEKQALSWNTQGQCRRGRLIKGSVRTIEEEAETVGTAWRKVKEIAGTGSGRFAAWRLDVPKCSNRKLTWLTITRYQLWSIVCLLLRNEEIV